MREVFIYNYRDPRYHTPPSYIQRDGFSEVLVKKLIEMWYEAKCVSGHSLERVFSNADYETVEIALLEAKEIFYK